MLSQCLNRSFGNAGLAIAWRAKQEHTFAGVDRLSDLTDLKISHFQVSQCMCNSLKGRLQVLDGLSFYRLVISRKTDGSRSTIGTSGEMKPGLLDAFGINFSYMVPFVCFVIIAIYGFINVERVQPAT